jgi:hypothetical protein
MSARRPTGRSREPVINENMLAGQVRDCSGISRAFARTGRTMLKPLMKYSYRIGHEYARIRMLVAAEHTAISIDARSEKQNPSSCHIVLKTSGLCLPSFST